MTPDKLSLMVSENVGNILNDKNHRNAFLDKIQSFGISGIEIMFGEKEGLYHETDALQKFTGELLRRGMCVPCVDFYVNYLQAGHFDDACKIADGMVQAAVVLESPLGMICGSVLPNGMSPEEGRQIVAQGVDRAIKTGNDKNVHLAIEAFGLSPILQSTSKMLKGLFGKLNEKPCFFVGDLANPCYGGESPMISLQAFIDKLRHVHVKDVKKSSPGQGLPSSKGYWLDEENIGMGIADVPGSLRFLNEKHYSGWYSLELVWGNNMDIIGQHSKALKGLLRTA